jgi:hypothetical protein
LHIGAIRKINIGQISVKGLEVPKSEQSRIDHILREEPVNIEPMTMIEERKGHSLILVQSLAGSRVIHGTIVESGQGLGSDSNVLDRREIDD